MNKTDQCRERLLQYCQGMGLDIGYGGQAISPNAITIDVKSFADTDDDPQHLQGDCRDLYWFTDEVFDFVFSSHLIQDFDYDVQIKILEEWLRVLKAGGLLILYQPDEEKYRQYCQEKWVPYKRVNKISDYSLENFRRNVLSMLKGEVAELYSQPETEIYSWECVLEKL